jgi:N-acetylmuramic acid 6-phosphate etherase
METNGPAPERATERLDPAAHGIDQRSTPDALALLLAGQQRALRAVDAALPALAQAVDLAVARLARGGRLVYLAAGSPALIALADALEIPQTYGEPPERFLAILAGGRGIVDDFAGGPEDDADAARRDVAAAAIGEADCVVAISASGSTPYVVAGFEAARASGAACVAVANNAGAPLFGHADVAVLLDTGAEIVAGSTRMGAGTAQKAALNMLSTAIAIRRGHVHDGQMVAVRADNAKLVARATAMIARTAGVDHGAAARALDAGEGDVKTAVLVAAGASDPADAARRLAASDGHLRPALAGLNDDLSTRTPAGAH